MARRSAGRRRRRTGARARRRSRARGGRSATASTSSACACSHSWSSGVMPVAEHVHGLRLAPEAGGQLLGDEHVGPVGDLQHAGDRVVIGDRHEVHPAALGQLVDLLGRRRALGQPERALDAELRELRRGRVAVQVALAVLSGVIGPPPVRSLFSCTRCMIRLQSAYFCEQPALVSGDRVVNADRDRRRAAATLSRRSPDQACGAASAARRRCSSRSSRWTSRGSASPGWRRSQSRRAAAPTRACCRRGSARACRAGRPCAAGSWIGTQSSTRLSRLRGIRSAELIRTSSRRRARTSRCASARGSGRGSRRRGCSPRRPGSPAQAADAAHVEVDLHAGARRVVERLDHVGWTSAFIFIAIRAWRPASRAAIDAVDQLEQAVEHEVRRHQRLAEALRAARSRSAG